MVGAHALLQPFIDLMVSQEGGDPLDLLPVGGPSRIQVGNPAHHVADDVAVHGHSQEHDQDVVRLLRQGVADDVPVADAGQGGDRPVEAGDGGGEGAGVAGGFDGELDPSQGDPPTGGPMGEEGDDQGR